MCKGCGERAKEDGTPCPWCGWELKNRQCTNMICREKRDRKVCHLCGRAFKPGERADGSLRCWNRECPNGR